MSVDALVSTERSTDYRGSTVNDHGKYRIQYFTFPAATVISDINSTIDLCILPPGRVRIIPRLSAFACSAWGAGRLLSIGHKTYSKIDATNAVGGVTDEPENATALLAATDVSAALTETTLGNAANGFGYKLKYDVFSKRGVRIFATITGGTLQVGSTLSGFITYVYE